MYQSHYMSKLKNFNIEIEPTLYSVSVFKDAIGDYSIPNGTTDDIETDVAKSGIVQIFYNGKLACNFYLYDDLNTVAEFSPLDDTVQNMHKSRGYEYLVEGNDEDVVKDVIDPFMDELDYLIEDIKQHGKVSADLNREIIEGFDTWQQFFESISDAIYQDYHLEEVVIEIEKPLVLPDIKELYNGKIVYK